RQTRSRVVQALHLGMGSTRRWRVAAGGSPEALLYFSAPVALPLNYLRPAFKLLTRQTPSSLRPEISAFLTCHSRQKRNPSADVTVYRANVEHAAADHRRICSRDRPTPDISARTYRRCGRPAVRGPSLASPTHRQTAFSS